MALDSQNDVFATKNDGESGTGPMDKIQEYDASGGLVRTFGQNLGSAEAVAVNAQGDVYVADGGNEDLQEYDPSGNLLRTFGTHEAGLAFSVFGGLAVNAQGDVFVSDITNAQIREYDASGHFVKTFARGFEFGSLAINRAGDLFVSDPDKIYEYDAGGSVIKTFAQGHSGALAFSPVLEATTAASTGLLLGLGLAGLGFKAWRRNKAN